MSNETTEIPAKLGNELEELKRQKEAFFQSVRDHPRANELYNDLPDLLQLDHDVALATIRGNFETSYDGFAVAEKILERVPSIRTCEEAWMYLPSLLNHFFLGDPQPYSSRTHLIEKYIPDSIRDDEIVARKALAKDPRFWMYMSDRLKQMPGMLRLLRFSGWPKLINNRATTEGYEQLRKDIPIEVSNHGGTMLHIANLGYYMLASDRLRENKSIVYAMLESIRFNPSFHLKHLPRKVLHNYGMVRKIFTTLKEYHGVIRRKDVINLVRRIPDRVLQNPLVLQAYLEALGNKNVDSKLNHFDFVACVQAVTKSDITKLHPDHRFEFFNQVKECLLNRERFQVFLLGVGVLRPHVHPSKRCKLPMLDIGCHGIHEKIAEFLGVPTGQQLQRDLLAILDDELIEPFL